MEQAPSRNPALAVELLLLLLLATLWGGSYTFIKLGIATIPPITLIAARTSIAGVLLLVIMHGRGKRRLQRGAGGACAPKVRARRASRRKTRR